MELHLYVKVTYIHSYTVHNMSKIRLYARGEFQDHIMVVILLYFFLLYFKWNLITMLKWKSKGWIILQTAYIRDLRLLKSKIICALWKIKDSLILHNLDDQNTWCQDAKNLHIFRYYRGYHIHLFPIRFVLTRQNRSCHFHFLSCLVLVLGPDLN